MKRILILYAYHNARSNLDYFLEHGIKPYLTHANLTLLIIHNGTFEEDLNCSKELNCSLVSNYIYLRTNHTGKAWKSWHVALNLINYRKFTYFIFLKDTVKGPKPSCNNWYDQMINLLTKDKRMVGLEYIIKPTSVGGSWVKHDLAIYLDTEKKFNAHISTPIWCTDLTGLEVILPSMIDDIPDYPKREFVIEKRLVEAGYTLCSLEQRFRWFELGKSESLSRLDVERMYRLHCCVDSNLLFQWMKKRHKFIYPLRIELKESGEDEVNNENKKGAKIKCVGGSSTS